MKNLKSYQEFLNEKKIFGDHVFTDPDPKLEPGSKISNHTLKEIIVGIKSNFDYTEEENTKIENEFFSILIKWVTDSSKFKDDDIQRLLKYRNIIDSLKKEYPDYFNPNGDIFYRGLDLYSNDLYDLIGSDHIDKFNPDEWHHIYFTEKFGKTSMYMYGNPIKWKERKIVQSWTPDFPTSRSFGCVSIATRDDGNFFLNSKFSNVVSNAIHEQPENENLHVGNTFSKPVYIILKSYFMEELIPLRLIQKIETITFEEAIKIIQS